MNLASEVADRFPDSTFEHTHGVVSHVHLLPCCMLYEACTFALLGVLQHAKKAIIPVSTYVVMDLPHFSPLPFRETST